MAGRLTRTVPLALAVAAALSACGGADAATTSTATHTPATGPLVSLTRGGGLAGRSVGVVVGPGGRVVPRPDGRVVRLTSRELAALRRELRAARLPPRGTTAPADPPVADGFTYAVRAGGHELVYGEEGPPAAARPLVRRLLGLLARTHAG